MSAVSCIIMLPSILMGVDVTRMSNSYYEATIGMTLAKIFLGPVVIRGEENIPRDGKGRVFITNHQVRLNGAEFVRPSSVLYP